MALSEYLTDTIAILNDQQYSFTSKPQLTRWVNEARQQCAKRTACVRRLITGQSAFGASSQPGFAIPGAAQPGSLPGAFPQIGTNTTTSGGNFNSPDFSPDFNIAVTAATATQPLGVVGAVQNRMMTIPGVERYPYEGFFNPVLKAEYAGCERVIDAIACAVNWGGTVRPQLDWMPWDNFQAYARAYAVLNMNYPALWTVYNDGPMGEVWLFPVPSQANEIELDVSAMPSALYSDNDPDAIPHGFRDAIKYKAASLAFMSSGRFASAQMMEDLFADTLGIDRVAVDRGKSPSYYGRFP